MFRTLIISAVFLMFLSQSMKAWDGDGQIMQETVTLKSQMELIHERFGVNFVYDASLELDRMTLPAPLVISDSDRASLELCLQTLFAGTGVEYRIMKKYVVLTKSEGRRTRDYEILIEEGTDTIPEARITAYLDRQRNATQTGLHSIDSKWFQKGFATLGSPDVIKEIQILPGVSGGTELLSGMYVHGGDGKDNLFLLDGVPLYHVSHFAGLLSSFNTEMIDGLDFYKSGFPSRYGGKTSSVVDITTRQGDMDSYHGSFSIGLLNGCLQFEGPIVPGKTSFNVGLRRSWFDMLTIPALAIVNSTLPYGKKIRFRYAMTDFNASVAHNFSPDSRLRLNLYCGSDFIGYGQSFAKVQYWEGQRYTGDDGHDLNVRWGNVQASLDWQKDFSENLHLRTILYYTRVNNFIRLANNSWNMEEYYPGITEYTVEEDNASRLHDLAAKAEIDWSPSQNHHIRAGAALVGHIFRSDRNVSVRSFVNWVDPEYESEDVDQVHERDSVSLAADLPEMSLYAEDELRLTDWLKANVGLRYVMSGTKDGMMHSLEPRAALRFQLSPRSVLKASYTEMSQFVHCLQANYLDVPMSIWMPSTGSIPPSRSRQVAAGIYVDIPYGLSLNVEGYWKSMTDIYEYCGISGIYPDIRAWEQELLRGRGRSYGAEVELSWRTRTTDVSAYYTLSWTERLFEDIWHDWYPARNDNRHKFTLNATHRFSKRFDMSLSWNYHSGDRTTIPTQIVDGKEYYSNPYNYKLPDYHRLDVGFNFRRTTKRGNESIWNLSVYNAYCRMNPMFAMYDSELIIMSAIPIIPSFSYTLRF